MRREASRSPLERPAAETVRDQALRLVLGVDKAVTRFEETGGARTLHDARVALRRLRGWLQAFDTLLGVKPRQRRRLRRLARASNIARDAEISLDLLAEMQPRQEAHARPQAASLFRSLRKLHEEHYRELRCELPGAWRKLAASLRHTIAGAESEKDGPCFRQVFADSLRGYAQGFEKALADARREPDARHIHRLRIAGKKARYLTETILPWCPQAGPVVRELTVLHDLAGRIQDLQRFIELSENAFLSQSAVRYRRLLARYTDVGVDDRRLPQGGSELMLPLLLVCRAAAKRQADYMTVLKKAYLGRSRPACVDRMHRLAARLDADITNR